MKRLNTFTLKMIAIITMVIDHVGFIFFPDVMVFRMIGRLSFPIFAFVLVEGFVYTQDVKKYMLRLGIFALLSEIPYDLAFMESVLEFSRQNVFFTLFFGVLMLYLISRTRNIIIQYGIVACLVIVCSFLHTDYSTTGLLIILIFSIFRERKIEKLLIVGLIFIALSGDIQLYAIFALPLIALHNGEQGPKLKTFFYLFYPAHLLILYLINLIV